MTEKYLPAKSSDTRLFYLCDSLCRFLSTLGDFSIHEPSVVMLLSSFAQFAAEKMATLKKAGYGWMAFHLGAHG